VLEIDQHIFGQDSLEVAQDLNSLAMVYEHAEHQEEAEAAYVRSIVIKRRKIGQFHDSLAIGVHNLANFYKAQKRYADAEPLLLEALQIRRQILKENHPNYARILSSLGKLYLAMGDPETAIQSLVQARDIYTSYMPESREAVLDIKIDLARAMFLLGDLQQAERIWIDALDNAVQSLGAEHALVVGALEGLVDLYEQQADFSRIRRIMHQLLPALTHRAGMESEVVTSQLQLLVRVAEQIFAGRECPFQLFDVGEDFYNLGEYAIALALYQESHQRLSETDPLFQIVVFAMANMQRILGNYEAAEMLLRHSLDMYTASKREISDVFDVIGSALEINSADLIDYSGHYSASIELLGSVLVDTGRYEEAKALYEKAFDIKLLSHTQSHPSILTVKQKIANLCQKIGDYATAKQFLDEVLQETRARGVPASEALANLLSSAGALYSNMGDNAETEKHFTEALQIARLVSPPGDAWLAVHVNNLGYHFLNIGQINRARPLLEEACELWRRTLGLKHPNYAEGLINLANVYERQGNVSAAGQAMVEALRIRMDSFGYHHPATAQAINNLGNLYLRIGSYGKAEAMLQLAASIRQDILGSAHPSLAITLASLITVYADQDQWQEALQVLQQQTVIHRTMIGQIFSAASERQRLALLAMLQPHMRSMLWVIWRIAQELPLSLPECFDLLLQRKGLSQEALAAQQIELFKDRHPAMIADFERLVILRQQLAAMYLNGPSPETLDTHGKQLADLEADKEKLEIALAQHVPEMDIITRLQQADRKAIASRLPPDSALVEFAAIPDKYGEGIERYLAFVLPAGRPDAVQMIDLGIASRLEEKLIAWRSAITGHAELPRGSGKIRQVEQLTDLRAAIWETVRAGGSRRKTHQLRNGLSEGIALRQLVFDPLLDALGKTKRLFIAPDSDLSRLPFESLPLDQDRYVLDEYRISYLAVGRDVLRLGPQTRRSPGQPLVIVDPDYDHGRSSLQEFQPGQPFPRLDNVHDEGDAVANLLHTSVVSGNQALKSILRNHPSPVILHLATHGYFLPYAAAQRNVPPIDDLSGQMVSRVETLSRVENPLLRSALVLAGVNVWAQNGTLPPEAGNGILTAEDITALDLLDTELVMLSACESGLGQVQVGEGIFGLRRAFVIAGAKTLVMSLWKVPDKQTRLLMELFYENLVDKHMGRADALRQAQLTLRRQYPKQPFYWGAFICQGDPRPLPLASHFGAEREDEASS
jgi:CHAT domain-containing protein/tetratricopeptide (TPR) repeat protein